MNVYDAIDHRHVISVRRCDSYLSNACKRHAVYLVIVITRRGKLCKTRYGFSCDRHYLRGVPNRFDNHVIGRYLW